MKYAFTLAETLITLAIIGVVAAVTIPILVNKIQDMHFKSLWKRAYSEINQAYVAAFGEDAINVPRGADTIVKQYSTEIYYQIFSRLSDDYCVKDSPYDHACGSYNNKYTASPKCSPLNNDKPNGACYYNGCGGYAILRDGVKIYAHDYIWNHPEFLVDVNGTNPPNVVGRDMFIILFRGNKVIPGGAPGYELYGCDKSVASHTAYYGADRMSGSGCGYKYLYE